MSFKTFYFELDSKDINLLVNAIDFYINDLSRWDKASFSWNGRVHSQIDDLTEIKEYLLKNVNKCNN